jgi:hypothetical protein
MKTPEIFRNGFLITSFNLLFALIKASEWILIALLSVFIYPLIYLFFLGSWIFLAWCAIVYLFWHFRTNWLTAVLPTLFNILTVLIFLFVPFTKIWLDYLFDKNYPSFLEVIELVENGEIPKEPGEHLTPLPKKYAILSDGQEIYIEQEGKTLSVFFFTFRGVLDNFSGFVYRSDDSQPPQTFMYGDWGEMTRIQPYWFFVASR